MYSNNFYLPEQGLPPVTLDICKIGREKEGLGLTSIHAERIALVVKWIVMASHDYGFKGNLGFVMLL